jgi:hypothetical protein
VRGGGKPAFPPKDTEATLLPLGEEPGNSRSGYRLELPFGEDWDSIEDRRSDYKELPALAVFMLLPPSRQGFQDSAEQSL